MKDETVMIEKIRELIQDFRFNYDKYKKLSEADVETKLVESLFEILGWNKNDFIKQERVQRGDKRGKADFAFKINDRTVFFVEAKKVGIPLDKEADKQVISYALSKRVPFAVSTNFETLKIFCVEQENAINNVFRVFEKPEDYLNDLQSLLFLSKENFENGLTLKKAESEGRLKKRRSIDKILLEDLMYVRGLIATDIEKNYSKKYELNEKDAIIQRILDRLIFIRRCEDVGINPENVTLEEIKHLLENKAYQKLKEIFSQYDKTYNSGLFAVGVDNDCDKITISGKIIQQLINYLYESKDGSYIYNFDWIDADVLGQVYEQYLGKILAQTNSGKAKLKEGQAHRKEQGIYYTPTYIVDYIVKNTVGELLKDKKVDASKIKILDPACGSGSFLIKAFDYLNEHFSSKDESKQKRIDSQGAYSIKTEILKNNLYGVDLDNKAVEITKLNLLLKAAEKNRKLPEEVDLHIKQGNSLINDENVAGLNAFKWINDFKEGTFDVVIGNPPYGAKVANLECDFLKKNYSTIKGEVETFALFYEKGITLLKEGGCLGFITPDSWFTNLQFAKLREKVIKETRILFILDVYKPFYDAKDTRCQIIILRKRLTNPQTVIDVVEPKTCREDKLNIVNSFKIPWKYFEEWDAQPWQVYIPPDERKIIQKIESNSVKLGSISLVKYGLRTGNNKEYIQDTPPKNTIYKLVSGSDINRYYFSWKPKYLTKTTNLSEAYFSDRIKKEKIVIQYVRTNSLDTQSRWLEATLIEDDFIGLNSTTMILEDNKEYPINYLLAIINSKLMNKYYKLLYTDVNIKPAYLSQLPIKNDIKLCELISGRVKTLIELNKKLQKFGDKQTSERTKIKEEIKNTDAEIDEMVYKIYGLTKEEIKIVEDSLK